MIGKNSFSSREIEFRDRRSPLVVMIIGIRWTKGSRDLRLAEF